MTYTEWIKWLNEKSKFTTLTSSATAKQLGQTYVAPTATGAGTVPPQQPSNFMNTAMSMGQTGMSAYGSLKQANAYKASTPQKAPGATGATPQGTYVSRNYLAQQSSYTPNPAQIGQDHINSQLNEIANNNQKSDYLKSQIYSQKQTITGAEIRLSQIQDKIQSGSYGDAEIMEQRSLQQNLPVYRATLQTTQKEFDQLNKTIADYPITNPYEGKVPEIDPDSIAGKLINEQLNATPRAVQETAAEDARKAAAIARKEAADAARKAADRADLMKFGGGALLAGGSGFGLFKSIGGMWKDGASTGGIFGAGGALVGLWGGLSMMKSALTQGFEWFGKPVLSHLGTTLHNIPLIGHGLTWLLTTPQGMIVVIAAVVVAAILTALFSAKPTAEEAELDKFNESISVWTPGKVLMMTSAAAFLSMGYNIDQPMDINSAGIPIETIKLQQALGNTLVNPDGSAFTGSIPYGVPLVLKGQNGAQDRVMILSKNGVDANGKARDSIKVITLAEGTSFGLPTKDAKGVDVYLPFVLDGKVNQEAVMSVTQQRALLEAQKALSASSAKTAAELAASLNKPVLRN